MSSKNIIDLRKRSSPRPTAPAHAPVRISATSAKTSRTSPLRMKRRRIRIIASMVLIVLLIVGIFALSYASYLPRYNIDTFAIEGAQTVSAPLISRYIETQLNTGSHPFFSPNNIFLFNTAALANNIVGFFPRIKSAQISRSSLLATAITVTVQERQQFALWCTAQSTSASCYSMDDTGFIFAQAPATTSVQKKIFSGGFSTTTSPVGHIFAPGHLHGMLAFFDQLKQTGFTALGATTDTNESDFTVSLAEGFDIKASFGQDAETLVRNLQLILSSDVLKAKTSDIQYVDLRFGDRAYYKLKTSSATSTP